MANVDNNEPLLLLCIKCRVV